MVFETEFLMLILFFLAHFFLNASRFDGANFCGAAGFFAKSALFQAANM